MGVDYRVIGKRIHQKRKEQRFTQECLAEHLSVSVGYISQIERGVTKINLDTLAKISSFLQCDIAELVSGSSADQIRYLNEEIGSLFARMNEKQKKLLVEIAQCILRTE